MIWKRCKGVEHIQTIKAQSWRIVEDQAKSYTRKLVSTKEAHDILEELLEASKHKLTDEFKCIEKHYLLFTPFRYPPLEQGSRFGRAHERSLFYASLDLKTALSEKAFYRIAFIRASAGEIGHQSIHMTSFCINVDTNRGIDLTNQPFASYKTELTRIDSYQASQLLGTQMREDGIEAFICYSARSKHEGKNLNIFSPRALKNNHHRALEKTYLQWSCYATSDLVEFTNMSSCDQAVMVYHASDFYNADGAFPGLP